MLKAGSLLYAIFIALLITSVATTFVLFAYYSRLHNQQYEAKTRALLRLNAALNYLKVETKEEAWKASKILFEEEPASQVQLQSEPWGVFRLIAAKTGFKQDTFKKAAIVGYAPQKEEPVALYLADKNQPLSLAGDARIRGNAYLSERGIKRAYIEGRSYSGKTTLEGIKKLSKSQLPAVNPMLESAIEMQLQKGIPLAMDTVYLYDEESTEGYLSIERSAHQERLGVYSAENIHLQAGKLIGPIIIKSEKEIALGADLKAEHLLLLAPKIVIASGFRGSVQAMASDSILIGSEVDLLYPSALVVKSEQKAAYIEVGEKSIVRGEVALLGDPNKVQSALIKINKEAVVEGNVYSAKAIALQGRIHGMATMEKFYLKTKSSVYENHLLDGVIDRNQLPEAYIGAAVLTEWSLTTKEIMAWLK